jgi:hypothetical protein
MPSLPGSGLVHRNLTHPHLGTQTSPHRRFSLRALVSRIAKPRTPRLIRNPGLAAGFPGSKNARIAVSKSRKACCWTLDDPAASHDSADRASAS